MAKTSSLSLSENNQHIPVFLVADDNYAPFVATTMASILKNTKSHVDFYVLSDGITDKNKAKIANERKWFKNFSLRFVEINDKLPTNLAVTGRLTSATYGRFFIPEVDPGLKKVIYLDDDIIVKRDIKELYDNDLSGYPLGASSVISKNNINDNKRLKRVNESCSLEHKYFNAGVLLIDVEKWRKDKVLGQLIECAKKYAKHPDFKLMDQDALNIVFNKNVKNLDRRFNHKTGDLQQFLAYNKGDEQFEKDAFEKAVVIHYTSSSKPWFSKKVPYAREFWKIVPYTDFADEIRQRHDAFQRDMKIMENQDKNAEKVRKHVNKKVRIAYILLGILISLNAAVLFVLVRRRK